MPPCNSKPARVVSYREAFRSYAKRSEADLARDVVKLGIKRPYERELNNAKRIMAYEQQGVGNSQQDDGLKRYEAFRRIFRTELMYSPAPFQMEFFELICQAVMMQIIDAHWNIYGPSVCLAANLTEIITRVAATAARRDGKTVTVACAIAALAIVLPKVQAIFSTSQRVSFALRDMVIGIIENSKYANRLPENGRGRSGEEIFIRSGLDDNTSEYATLKFLPANEKISYTIAPIQCSRMFDVYVAGPVVVHYAAPA